MQGKEKMLDDLARLAGGAAGIASNAKNQVKLDFKTRIDQLAVDMDLIPRSEFERLEAVLLETRAEMGRLQARVEKLEGKKGKS